MHTPDGFLTNWICIVTLILSITFVGISIYNLKKSITRQKILQMSGIAAIIFAFQMLNFPIASGTSGHLIGAGIAAILLGPSAAILILTGVLIVQTFVYGDGGMLAIGANILNMGVVASYSTYYSYKYLSKTNNLFRVGVASLIGVVLASLANATELWLSGSVNLVESLISMGAAHLLVGMGEAIISIGIFIYAQTYLLSNKFSLKHVFASVVLGLTILAIFLPLASPHPDGLESVAINLGFFESATTIYPYAIMSNYTFLGSEEYIFVLISGIIGTTLTFLIMLSSGILLPKKSLQYYK